MRDTTKRRKEKKEAADRLVSGARPNDAEAQFNLGKLYAHGMGVEVDYAEAERRFLCAAEQGYAPAQLNLGILYEYGIGVVQDYDKAWHWYCRVAEQENSGILFNLSLLNEYGIRIEPGYTEVARWKRRFTDKGDSIAQKFALLEQRLETLGYKKTREIYKTVEELKQKAQNNGLKSLIIPPLSPVESKTIFERASEYFAGEGVTNQNRPAMADMVTRLVELDRRDPPACKTTVGPLSALAELAVNDPALFAAKITAAEKVRVAGTGRPLALSHAQREEIRQRRKNGEKVSSLAAAYGVSEKTIFLINKEASPERGT